MRSRRRPLSIWFVIAAVLFSMQTTSRSNDDEINTIKWLMENYNGKSTNAVVDDGQFISFLKLVVPNKKLELGAGTQLLRLTFWDFIHGPPDDVMVVKNRYVILSACRAHSCPEKAWLWCDAKEGLVVGAIIHYYFGQQSSNDPMLLVFSNQPDTCNLPVDCKEALHKWLDKNAPLPKIRRCLDRTGSVHTLGP